LIRSQKEIRVSQIVNIREVDGNIEDNTPLFTPSSYVIHRVIHRQAPLDHVAFKNAFLLVQDLHSLRCDFSVLHFRGADWLRTCFLMHS